MEGKGKSQGGGRVWIAALMVVAAFVTMPAVADASCGGPQTKSPKKKVNPGGRAPLAIGDSTMLLSIPALARVGYRVNARGCRMWPEGMSVLKTEKRNGRLPHMVLISLGASWKVSKPFIRQALHILGKKRVLTLMTPLELGGWSGSDARNVRWAFRQYPKRVLLLDWVRYSKGRGSWFQPDRLHLTFSGADAMARLAGMATPWARYGQMPDKTFFPKAKKR